MRDITEVLSGERRWTVVTGSCVDILQTIDGRVDHVITDPPFEVEAHTLQRRVKPGAVGGGEKLSSEPLSFAPMSQADRVVVGSQIARLTKRWALVFCQCEASQTWASCLAPLNYKRTAVWVKPDAMPQYSGDRPGMGYESIVVAHAPGKSKWNGGGRVGVFVHNKNSGGKHLHETQKPESLMVELIDLFTDPGDVVLDPYCGSGSTLISALRRGRRAIGIEINPEYAELARERCRAEESGSNYASRSAGQGALFG
jgi:16S rRNA G966 N2-methylase RsmD